MRQQFKVLAGKARRSGRLQEVALFDEAGLPFDLSGLKGKFFPILDLINGHNHTFVAAEVDDFWGHNLNQQPGFVALGGFILGVGGVQIAAVGADSSRNPTIYPLPDECDVRTSFAPIAGQHFGSRMALLAEIQQASVVPGETDNAAIYIEHTDDQDWLVDDIIYLTGLIALRRSVILTEA
jgi:hypothetical protein